MYAHSDHAAAAAAVTRVVSSGHINVQVNILTKVRLLLGLHCLCAVCSL
jgi:hypothetical protein